MDSTIACNTLETFHIPMFDPGTMCLIFLIVINAVNGAMDGEVTPDATKPPRRFIKVFFHKKGIGNVKLTDILHNKLVRSKIPIYFQEEDPPLVSYKYTNNISRSVFNYNQALRNISVDDYRNASSSSDCQSSTFRYEPHGHVITGDLRIVRNRKLRRLLEKGPKYREQNNIALTRRY